MASFASADDTEPDTSGIVVPSGDYPYWTYGDEQLAVGFSDTWGYYFTASNGKVYGLVDSETSERVRVGSYVEEPNGFWENCNATDVFGWTLNAPKTYWHASAFGGQVQDGSGTFVDETVQTAYPFGSVEGWQAAYPTVRAVPGLRFKGWTKDATGAADLVVPDSGIEASSTNDGSFVTVVYSDAQKTAPTTEDVHYYAVWEPRDYELYLNLNKEGATLPQNATGWTRGVWNTEEGTWTKDDGELDGSTIYTYKRDHAYLAGQTISLPTPPGGLTRLSGWSGGAPGEVKASVAADSSVSYAFTPDPDSEGFAYRDYSLLTADWGTATYQVEWVFNYKTDGGAVVNDTYTDTDPAFSNGVLTKSVSYGDTIATPAIKSECYRFLGWYATKAAAMDAREAGVVTDGDIYGDYLVDDGQGGYVFKPANDGGRTTIRFFAAWSKDPVPYTITLKANGHGAKFSDSGSDTLTRDNTYSKTLSDWNLFAANNKPVATEPGWTFAGWKEEVYVAGVPTYVDFAGTTVKRGSGDHTYIAQWKVTSKNAYSVTFHAGDEVSDPTSPDYVEIASNAAYVTFDASTPTIAIPALEGRSTTGYDFAGWYRATEDAEGNLTLTNERIADGKTTFTGQELVNKGIENVHYVATWTPKTFTIRYFESDGTQMDAYEGDEVVRSGKYTDSIVLPAPAFKKTGAIFSHWTDAKKNAELYPQEEMTVSELIGAVGAKTEGSTNVIDVYAYWTHIVSSSMPLTVNIAFDPERLEESIKVSPAWISTTCDAPVFVESVTLEKGEHASQAFAVADVNGIDIDKSELVNLTVQGSTKDDAETLKLSLGQGSVTRGVDKHGLGVFSKDSAIDVTYGLDFTDPACPAPTEFKYLNEHGVFKDTSDTYTIAKLFYTIGLVPQPTA